MSKFFISKISLFQVIATTSGTLYHCIVLPKSDDDVDVETSSQVSDWSTSAVPPSPIDLDLFVFEQIELELSLVSESGESSQKPFDYPLLLSVDPLSPSRYFTSCLLFN